MKKLAILLCILSVLLSGCSVVRSAARSAADAVVAAYRRSFHVDYEEETQATANQTLALLLDALQRDDKTAAAEVFSANMRQSLADFPQKLDELFAYFDGEVQGDLHTDFSGISRGVNYGEYRITVTVYCDIITTADSYRMTFSLTALDTETPENEGIWSLSILRAEDDPLTDSKYGGDWTYADGIHVGALCAPVTEGNYEVARKLSLQAMDDLLAALREGETEAAAALFASNAKAQAENFPQELEALHTLFGSGEVELTVDRAISVDYGRHANNQYQEHGVFTYRAETPHGTYLLALKQTYYDSTVTEDIGLWSLYVFPLPDDGETPTVPEAEKDYVPGIHIIEGTE